MLNFMYKVVLIPFNFTATFYSTSFGVNTYENKCEKTCIVDTLEKYEVNLTNAVVIRKAMNNRNGLLTIMQLGDLVREL